MTDRLHNKDVKADMHVHSEFSHDSVVRIEDMVSSGLENGLDVIAITDHFDTAIGLLLDIGFERLYYFKNRKPIAYEI